MLLHKHNQRDAFELDGVNVGCVFNKYISPSLYSLSNPCQSRQTQLKDNLTMDIKSEQSLREYFPPTMELAKSKQMSRLDKHSRNFISKSPFLCLSTANKLGKADVSPRGDPPGFVQVQDDKTLIIPDRPGNHRLDTMVNIVENQNVGLLFFIPGIEDTLRVAGRAKIIKDEAVLARCTVNGKIPQIGISVEIDEIFFHCAKALKRSHLWSDQNRLSKSEMPTLARIILDQTSLGGQCEDDTAVVDTEKDIQEGYIKELY